MAEIIATETVVRKQGIARVELFTDAVRPEGDRIMRVHFEDFGVKSDGAIDTVVSPPRFGSRVVERKFGAIAADAITAGGVTVTVAQLAALIAAAAYKYRAEDVAAEED